MHIHASPSHHIGGNPKDGDFVGISQYNWEIDYKTMVVTAAWEADHPYQVSKRNPNPHDTDRKLVITVPDADYWCALKDTVIGVQPNGALNAIDRGIGGNANHIILRNDREKLQAVLAFASAYYFEPRQAISITCNYVSVTEPVSADLGTYIKDMVGLQLQEPVKCVVTTQEIDYRRQQTITKTSYLSLDEMIQAGLGFVGSAPGRVPRTVPGGNRFNRL